MLSILIPVYNFDVRQLVADLKAQCEEAGQPFEIICFDDLSISKYQEINSGVKSSNVEYIELEKNLGRSAIRNALGKAAQYPYLLFMDCDSKVVKTDFIKAYLDHLEPNTLLYGGRCYSPTPRIEADYFFHWKYGIEREQSSVAQREKQPWHSFMTNNFLIPKNVFEKINFDESLKQYGHEDTLFGLELAKEKIHIKHLDNPLEHIGLETTEVFLKKTEQGLENLFSLWKKGTPIETKLLNYFIKINNWRSSFLIAFIFKIIKPFLIKQLKSNNPNLLFFDFYKLGFMCSLYS